MPIKTDYVFITVSNYQYRYHDTGVIFSAENDEDNGIIIERRLMGDDNWVFISKLKNINEVSAMMVALDFNGRSVYPFNRKLSFIKTLKRLFGWN